MAGHDEGAVVAFYDTHPINETQILEKLRADGHDPAALTEDILQAYDQDHFGGTAANDALADLARIGPADHLVDVCCGMGGPSRYFAANWGCRVTGIDLTQSRVDGARRLTELAGLAGRVTLMQGDALDMPFPTDSFDVLVSQEAFCHVPRKDRLIAECARVVRPGGRIAFTDIVTTATTPPAAIARLEEGMSFMELGSAPAYRAALEREGCAVVEAQDLGPAWAQILADRLAMYRGLKDQTVARFGEAHFRKWDEAYSFFVGLYQTGEMGGVRILARKAA